jgi:hypothetical protein
MSAVPLTEQTLTDWAAWSREAVEMMVARNAEWPRKLGLVGAPEYRWDLDAATLVLQGPRRGGSHGVPGGDHQRGRGQLSVELGQRGDSQAACAKRWWCTTLAGPTAWHC